MTLCKLMGFTAQLVSIGSLQDTTVLQSGELNAPKVVV